MKLVINFVVVIILLFGIGCNSIPNTSKKPNELLYEKVDSILIESTDRVRFLSHDSENNRFLFYETVDKNLILYDARTKTSKNLSYLKEEFPSFNNLVIGASLSNDTLTIISHSGYFQFSISENKILYSKKDLIAKVIDRAARVIPYKEKGYISNLTPLNSMQRDSFKIFSFAIYDSLGNAKNYFGNLRVPSTPDIRTYIEFDIDNDQVFQYRFPYDKLYFAHISSLIDGQEMTTIPIDVSFLKNHPYYNSKAYDIGDFPYIPLIYGFHVDKKYIYLHLAEGGDVNAKVHHSEYFLIQLNRKGELIDQYELNDGLFQIVATLDEDTHLFLKGPQIEYEDKTVFDILRFL